MENSVRYRFSDFIFENYIKLIKIAKLNDYEFVSFDSAFSVDQKCILWRHDVEFSPENALRMAEIENQENVKATYFFQLHSEFYNVLERHNSDILQNIISYGHQIGLHFDTHYFKIENEKDIDRYLLIDKCYFENIFGIKIKVFSFHNTNNFVRSCRKKEYGGLLNVYSDYFTNMFNYCTDSTGFWRYEILEDILTNKNISKLQVLTHDAMWQEEILPPRQRIFRTIDKQADYLKKYYDGVLRKFGATNVDWFQVL